MNFEIAGEPAHTRGLFVAFTQGEGESIEFRADILDLRKSGLMELVGRIASAGIIHKMELRGAFSAATGCLERIEWDQSHVMHEANRATQGECCRDPMERLAGLVGVRLGDGFAADLKQCFGGPLGCTHVNTLFQELSAFVARLALLKREHAGLRVARVPGERLARRSVYFDALLPEGGETANISVRLSDLYFGERNPDDESERLFVHDEVRLVTEVELAGWRVRELQGGQRSRLGPAVGPEPWQGRSDELADFAGRSLGGGITRFCLDRFAGREADACLLSALLCLAPGMTQVGVALSESLDPSPKARPGGMARMGPGPCYMLRAEGPLMGSLFPGDPEEATGAAGDTE